MGMIGCVARRRYNDLHASPSKVATPPCVIRFLSYPIMYSCLRKVAMLRMERRRYRHQRTCCLSAALRCQHFLVAGHADFRSEAEELRSRPCWINRDKSRKSGATGSMEDGGGQRSSASFEVFYQAPNASPVVTTKIFVLRT
jgi:hypothetical protein